MGVGSGDVEMSLGQCRLQCRIMATYLTEMCLLHLRGPVSADIAVHSTVSMKPQTPCVLVLQVQIYRYDGEEWLNVISRDNALVSMGWTKEETDYLLDMLEQYDLRFVVVADRYNVSWVGMCVKGRIVHVWCVGTNGQEGRQVGTV